MVVGNLAGSHPVNFFGERCVLLPNKGDFAGHGKGLDTQPTGDRQLAAKRQGDVNNMRGVEDRVDWIGLQGL